MNKTINHKGHIILAFLLSGVLFSSILIKPIHILIVHHDVNELFNIHQNQLTISKPHHAGCAICNLVFCSFLSQRQVIVPQVNIITYELASGTVACFVSALCYHFQLRAPPILNSTQSSTASWEFQWYYQGLFKQEMFITALCW